MIPIRHRSRFVLSIAAAIVAAGFLASALAPAPRVLVATPASAPPMLDVGSDGSDGVFTFVPDTPGGTTMTIDLALAASGLDGQGQPITWQTPSPVPGRGVYDSGVWAVVFKYSEVTIPAGAVVTFTNHPSRAPVVWLVQTTCTVGGRISLDGAVSIGGRAEPGPGGFRGGNGYPAASGHGPGGSGAGIGFAEHACPSANCYGSAACFPLVGGSGSGGIDNSTRGGGGAFLLAAGTRISLLSTSAIEARGQSAGLVSASSGGVLRLVSDEIVRADQATVHAGTTGFGNPGHIRFEANSFLGHTLGTPTPTLGAPSQLLPDAATPALQIVTVTADGATHAVPADPRADPNPTSADVAVPIQGSATIMLEARNVAPGRTCTLRVLDVVGAATTYTSAPLVGTFALSTTTVTVPLGATVYAMQARVVL